MITGADLRRRLEALRCCPTVQETKTFFIYESSDKALTKAQWEAVKTWEQGHSWGQAHVIVFKEINALLDQAYARSYKETGSDG